MKREDIIKIIYDRTIKDRKTLKLYGKHTWTVNISHEMQLGKFIKWITLD